MKKRRKDIFDREPWYKNHESPMAKWIFNFSMIGALWGNPWATIWFIVFNQITIVLYITIAIMIAFAKCNGGAIH